MLRGSRFKTFLEAVAKVYFVSDLGALGVLPLEILTASQVLLSVKRIRHPQAWQSNSPVY